MWGRDKNFQVLFCMSCQIAKQNCLPHPLVSIIHGLWTGPQQAASQLPTAGFHMGRINVKGPAVVHHQLTVQLHS